MSGRSKDFTDFPGRWFDLVWGFISRINLRYGAWNYFLPRCSLIRTPRQSNKPTKTFYKCHLEERGVDFSHRSATLKEFSDVFRKRECVFIRNFMHLNAHKARTRCYSGQPFHTHGWPAYLKCEGDVTLPSSAVGKIVKDPKMQVNRADSKEAT